MPAVTLRRTYDATEVPDGVVETGQFAALTICRSACQYEESKVEDGPVSGMPVLVRVTERR